MVETAYRIITTKDPIWLPLLSTVGPQMGFLPGPNLNVEITGIENGTIFTGVQKSIGAPSAMHCTSQTCPHATSHHGFNRNLAVNVVSFCNSSNTGQHLHRAAGKDHIRRIFRYCRIQRVCDQTMIAGASVIGGHMDRQTDGRKFRQT